MEFSGERFLPHLRGAIAYEHFHRYGFCAPWVSGLKVLDAACGEGYGSAYLARFASDVVGIDIDEPTIVEARARYVGSGNLLFDVGDVRRLPYDDGSFDIVVCFETIEHVAEPAVLLREVVRVLRPRGRLIVSTPNRPVYALRGSPSNPFHLHEFDLPEFQAALNESFPNVAVLGQRFHLVSALGQVGETPVAQGGEILCKSPDTSLDDAALTAVEPVYFVAVCSKAKEPLPTLRPSLFLDPGDDLWAEQVKTLRWASGVDKELDAFRAAVDQSRRERDELEKRLERESLATERLAALGLGQSGQAALTQTLGKLDRLCERLERSNQVVHGLQAELASARAAASSDQQAASSRAQAREQELIDLKAAQLALRSAHETATTRLDRLGVAHRVAKEELDRALGEVRSLQAERDGLMARVEGAVAACRDVEGELERVQAERHSLRATRDDLIARLEATTAELGEAREDHDRVSSKLDQAFADQRRTEADRSRDLDEIRAARIERDEAVRLNMSLAENFTGRMSVLRHRSVGLQELVGARVPRASAAFSAGAILPRAVAAKAGGLWTRPGRRMLREIRALLAEHGLFAPAWYRKTFPDVPAGGDEDTFEHFVTDGLVKGRDPHPLFSGAWLVRNGDVPGDMPPLASYVLGRTTSSPHPVFDDEYYLAENPDVRSANMRPLLHYVRYGSAEGRRPHPAFDPAWYRRGRGDIVDPSGMPLVDYLQIPSAFFVDPHPLFNGVRYLRQVPGLAENGINPLLHYLVRGERDGRAPHPLFDPPWYLEQNPDVAAAGASPLVHFLRHGGAERRSTHPSFDPWFYAEASGKGSAGAAAPLLHYVTEGFRDGRLPSRDFPLQAVIEALPHLDIASEDPLAALVEGKSLQLDTRLDALTAAPSETSMAKPRVAAPDAFEDGLRRLGAYAETRCGADYAAHLRDLMLILRRFEEVPAAFDSSIERADLELRLTAGAGRAAEEPDASILIPVHNALAYTLTCVVTLLESASRASFEILIGDDASTDATPDVFGASDGRVRLIRHGTNLGFLENCNAIGREARGRHLVFLNNDTLPMPGWLDAMIDLAERDRAVGLVGSKLLNSDGTLQEAGGIVWADGSAWNFGRDGDPNAASFNYVKDVDYCSGAAILVPRPVWDELRGFDPEFRPAYCEDSDFAFRARAKGYRTVYQPFSEVIHHEGRSHGRDETQGLKAYQVMNKEKLVDRWIGTLSRENWPNGENVFVARDRSRHRPHLLVVDHYVPQWDRDAGSRTMTHFLRAFVERGFHVTFWSDNLYQDPVYTRPLQELGIEIIYGAEYVGQFEAWFSANAAWIPYVMLSRPHVSVKFIDAVKRLSDAKILYYGHDLHWRRLQEEYAVNGNPEAFRESEFFRELETRVASQSDVVMYPNEDERAIVADLLGEGKTVLAVPAWTFDAEAVDAARRSAERADARDLTRLLFVGGFVHGPNEDGLLWFTREVMPRLQERHPGFHLTVVGSNPTEAVLALDGADISVTGQVTDAVLASLYEMAGIAIVPLRYGGGVKGKLIESLAKAVPVVSTPVGVQGIPEAEELVFIGRDAEEFADAILQAVADPALAAAKVRRGVEFIARDYTVARLFDKLVPTIPELGRADVRGQANPADASQS